MDDTIPLPALTPAQRQELKARAHTLEPVVMIGDAGLTDAVLAEADRALAAHQLIKIRVRGDDRAVREDVMRRVCEALDALPVQSIGKVLVVWRPSPDGDAAEGGSAAARRPRGPYQPKKSAGSGAPRKPAARRKPRSTTAPGRGAEPTRRPARVKVVVDGERWPARGASEAGERRPVRGTADAGERRPVRGTSDAGERRPPRGAVGEPARRPSRTTPAAPSRGPARGAAAGAPPRRSASSTREGSAPAGPRKAPAGRAPEGKSNWPAAKAPGARKPGTGPAGRGTAGKRTDSAAVARPSTRGTRPAKAPQGPSSPKAKPGPRTGARRPRGRG